MALQMALVVALLLVKIGTIFANLLQVRYRYKKLRELWNEFKFPTKNVTAHEQLSVFGGVVGLYACRFLKSIRINCLSAYAYGKLHSPPRDQPALENDEKAFSSQQRRQWAWWRIRRVKPHRNYCVVSSGYVQPVSCHSTAESIESKKVAKL